MDVYQSQSFGVTFRNYDQNNYYDPHDPVNELNQWLESRHVFFVSDHGVNIIELIQQVEEADENGKFPHQNQLLVLDLDDLLLI